MKRIIQLLFVFFALNAGAQTVYPVFVQGCLIPNNGANVTGLALTLNFQGGGATSTYTLFTNSNGCVSDSINLPSNNGLMTVSVQDCNGFLLGDTFSIQNSVALSNFSINYCTSPTGSTCTAVPFASVQGINASFTGSAIGAGPFTYFWQIFYNGMTYSYNSQNFTQAIAQPGSYLYCLTVTNASGCSNTVCDTLIIGGSGGNCQAIPSVNVQGINTYFSGNASGTGPFTYLWQIESNGITSTYNTQNVLYVNNQSSSIYYCLTVTSSTGCSNTACDTLLQGTNPPLISGYITKNNVAANDAIVFLIEADSSNQGITLTAIDTAYSNSNGYYSFAAPVGVYHVKAALQTSDVDYGSFLPTYYSNSASWAYSTAVYPTPIGSIVDINLIAGNFTGGPGFIGGLVSQGAGRPAGPGDPIPSAQVILFDNAMNALRTTFTDSQGNYEFTSLPYGTYKVQVEMLGKPSDILTVTLDANNASNTGSIFEVNSTSINLTSVGIEDITNNKNVRIFPNPSNGNLNLQIEDFDQTFNLEVLEISGKTVMTKVISSANSTLNISELPNGIYFLNLSNSNSRMNFKIVKN